MDPISNILFSQTYKILWLDLLLLFLDSAIVFTPLLIDSVITYRVLKEHEMIHCFLAKLQTTVLIFYLLHNQKFRPIPLIRFC